MLQRNHFNVEFLLGIILILLKSSSGSILDSLVLNKFIKNNLLKANSRYFVRCVGRTSSGIKPNSTKTTKYNNKKRVKGQVKGQDKYELKPVNNCEVIKSQ